MTDLVQQLTDEHQEIVKRFADNPYVALSFSDGDPPRKYEVEYKIKGGVRQEDGSVGISEIHLVSILLPFGYPNFPPNCKPLTPIFHPDFDSAAICISDFWNESKSLPGLISYIGRMISGQVFGSEHAFNPEAAKWYLGHVNRLPFDSVDFGKGVEDVGVETDGEIELNLVGSDLPPLEEVDTLIIGEQVGLDGKRSLDSQEERGESLDLVIEKPAEHSEQAAAPQGDVSLGASQLQSSPDVVPEDQVEGKTEKEGEGDDLAAIYAEEQVLKKKNLIRTVAVGSICLLVLSAAYFLAMDIFNYQKAESSWQGTDDLLNQHRYKEVKAKGDLALVEISKLKVLKKSDAERLRKEIEALLKTKDFQGGLVGKTLYEGSYVKKETIPVRKAVKASMEKGHGAIAVEEWGSALLSFQEAQELAESIQLDDQETLAVLERAIEKSRLNQLIKKGSEHLGAGELNDAITIFQKASELANAGADIDAEKIAFIHQSLDKALLQKFIKEGEGAFTAVQLDKALSSFEQALLLAEKETSAAPEYARGIRKSIQQINLYQLLEKGKTEYEASEWGAALLSFQEALRFILDEAFGYPELASNETAIRKKILQVSLKLRENEAANYRVQKKLAEVVEEKLRIIEQIENSPFKDDPEFMEIVEHSRTAISNLNFEIDIARKINYLIENYQEIFQANHSLAHSATLRYPVVVFLQEDGENQLYNLKCTGYTSTGKISLELNYSYDVGAKKWALFNRK